MVNIELLADKILRCIGLADALQEILYSLPVDRTHKKNFNSAFAVFDCLDVELNNTYDMLRGEL